QRQRQKHQRQRHHRRGGKDFWPGLRLPGREQRNRHRDGALFGGRQERQGEEKLVPGVDEHQDGGRGQPGGGERQEYFAEGLERRAPVEAGGAVKLVRNLAKKRGEDPERQRKGKYGVGEDEACEGVAKPQASDDQKQRADGGDRWKHGDQ